MNEYHKNVTIVLNFLKGRGYAQSTVKNHERFYTLLADDLAAKDITYSPEYGKALLSTLPVPAWLPKSRIENAACISKLDDAYIHGCIINCCDNGAFEHPDHEGPLRISIFGTKTQGHGNREPCNIFWQ